MPFKFSFSIDISNRNYSGYLQSNDLIEPPKTFFVFLENYIVGELNCSRGKWTFGQGGRNKILGKFLNSGECNYLAEYLGNIAVLGYDSVERYGNTR